MEHELLTRAGATPFDEVWSLLETDKAAFVQRMQKEQKAHDEQLRANITSFGNPEYKMMQLVWAEFHKSGGKRPVLRVSQPVAPQVVGVYAVNPALTQTRANPQVVQWVQGNRIIMRPENREVMPGEPMSRVRIIR